MNDLTTTNYHPHWPLDWFGLDYETADNATPKLYGVSFGNGNDGVSHMFASYYCRTTDPFTLATAALIGQFKPEFMAQAAAECDTNGEAEYTVSACLYEPLDRKEPESEEYVCEDCGHEWSDESSENDNDMCPACKSEDVSAIEPEDTGSWCDANGAYMICEVFPVTEDDMRDGRMVYDNLEDCFGAGAPELKLARD